MKQFVLFLGMFFVFECHLTFDLKLSRTTQPFPYPFRLLYQRNGIY